jgi:hypothetical protein
LKWAASVWWELLILWLLLQVPLSILVGFWMKDPTDEKEIPAVGRDTLTEPLFVPSGEGAEP